MVSAHFAFKFIHSANTEWPLRARIQRGAQCPQIIAWLLFKLQVVMPIRDKLFHFLLWKDFPSPQPIQVEERRKWEELQVPELQACQQVMLTQSTCPGKEG
jgi:hypothetical protein